MGKSIKVAFKCRTCSYIARSTDTVMLAKLVEFHQRETGHVMAQHTMAQPKKSEPPPSFNSDVLAHLKGLQQRDLAIRQRMLIEGSHASAKLLGRCLVDRQNEIDRLVAERKRRARMHRPPEAERLSPR